MTRCEIPQERFHGLTRELKARGIRRDYWPAIREQAETCRTEQELDQYLDWMEMSHSRYL